MSGAKIVYPPVPALHWTGWNAKMKPSLKPCRRESSRASTTAVGTRPNAKSAPITSISSSLKRWLRKCELRPRDVDHCIGAYTNINPKNMDESGRNRTSRRYLHRRPALPLLNVEHHRLSAIRKEQ